MNLSPGEKAEERDELAHDVAQLWASKTGPWYLMRPLADALDRLAEAYGLETVQELGA